MKDSTLWYIVGILSTFVAVVAFNQSGWYSHEEYNKKTKLI